LEGFQILDQLADLVPPLIVTKADLVPTMDTRVIVELLNQIVQQLQTIVSNLDQSRMSQIAERRKQSLENYKAAYDTQHGVCPEEVRLARCKRFGWEASPTDSDMGEDEID